MVPILLFKPTEPTNLLEVLESQARRLIEVGVPGEVKVAEDKFLDDAMAKARAFTYSSEFASIQLDRVQMVHYDVRDRYLAEAGGVACYADPDKLTLYKSVVIPEGLQVAQYQFGAKYRNRKPVDIRQSHDDLEELGVAKEGLTAYLYWGEDLLRQCCMDFPGSNAQAGDLPNLRFECDEPQLHRCGEGDAHPDFGSVTWAKY